MAITQRSAANIQAMVQEVWSPIFTKELREKTMLAGLVDKKYSGEIKVGGDTVYVSQIDAAAGQLLTVGTDADSFTPEALSSQTIAIKADKRAVGSYEFEDLAVIQSQLSQQDSSIRESLLFSVMKQVNDYLYSLVAPAAANQVVSADLDAAAMKEVRVKAGQAKWMRDKPWYGLADPQYHGDLLDATTMVSSDFVGDRSRETGNMGRNRYGFSVMEDDSRGPSKEALFFHPDFMHLVQQIEPTFKISDLHSNNKFGYVISVDLVFGAKLGIAGDEKHITVRTV